ATEAALGSPGSSSPSLGSRRPRTRLHQAVRLRSDRHQAWHFELRKRVGLSSPWSSVEVPVGRFEVGANIVECSTVPDHPVDHSRDAFGHIRYEARFRQLIFLSST